MSLWHCSTMSSMDYCSEYVWHRSTCLSSITVVSMSVWHCSTLASMGYRNEYVSNCSTCYLWTAAVNMSVWHTAVSMSETAQPVIYGLLQWVCLTLLNLSSMDYCSEYFSLTLLNPSIYGLLQWVFLTLLNLSSIWTTVVSISVWHCSTLASMDYCSMSDIPQPVVYGLL